MRLRRYTATLMLTLLSLAAALAQSVNVNVMPLRDVLPPQVMYYLSNPGQYFNITVQNPSTEAQQIFFGAELRQVTPASGLEVVVPAKTMPRQPIEVGAGATRVLTAAEMRTMFNHVRSSDVSMPICSPMSPLVPSATCRRVPTRSSSMPISGIRTPPRLY